MKWFKHYTDAEYSEALSKIEQKFGFEGLGRYWRFVEFLGRNFDGETTIFRIERSKLRALFRHRSWNDLETFGDHLAIIPGMELVRSGNVWEINAPILLELQSRDFKKARDNRAQPAPKIKIKNKNNKKNIKKDFETQKPHPALIHDAQFHFDPNKIIGKYPRPIENPKRARRELFQLFTKDPDFEPKFLKAIENYKLDIAEKDTEPQFVKSFPSFLECWEFWENPPKSESDKFWDDFEKGAK